MIKLETSSLRCERDPDGTIDLLLLQAPVGEDVLGYRNAFARGQPNPPNPAQIAACQKLLALTAPDSLTVISFHPGIRGCSADMERLAKDRTVIALEGIDTSKHNIATIATAGNVIRQEKLSLSSEDVSHQVTAGNTFHVFLPAEGDAAVRWAVFNCHDYSHIDLVQLVQQYRLELIVVVTFNAATRLFWEYAISDVHRLCCYVVIANIAEIGGSGVFAPFRRIGREPNAQLAAGGEIFVAKGPAELTVRLKLYIGKLRGIRQEFSAKGFAAIESSRARDETPMVPSEHYMSTNDRPAGPPPVTGVDEHRMEWVRKRLRVAVAQLTSMGTDAYVDTRYRIREHGERPAFERLLEVRLNELAHRCEGEKERPGELDVLILPEVFVPRTFLSRLTEFSERHRTTIVAGVDYPDDPNANECVVIRPDREPVVYRKITRSQYDARTHGSPRMPLSRGDRLLRFVDSFGHGFGILICYDYSHFDLLWRLNMEERSLPLEATIVIAHNPFADLYRWCCLADAHRFYQFVIMCNVAEFGGSGMFAPMRTPGARQVIAEAGKGAESILLANLPLGELIHARENEDESLHRGRFMRRPGIFQGRWT